jgi:hypothetical protein
MMPSLPLAGCAGFILLMAHLLISPFFLTTAMGATGTGTDWQLLKDTPDSVSYIDTGSIEKTADLTMKVFYKTTAKTKAYREFIQDIRSEDGVGMEGYNKFSYTLSRVEIDCASMRQRVLEAVDYDKNGKALGKPLSEVIWRKISPATLSAALAAWVCEEHPLINDLLDEEGDGKQD